MGVASMSIRLRVDASWLLGACIAWMACAGAPGRGATSAQAGVPERPKKTYVDAGRRFAFDYPARCSLAAGSRVEIGDSTGPDLFVEAEEIGLENTLDKSAARNRVVGYMYDWVNNHHFADGPEGSIRADSIRVMRRFKTSRGLPAYEWQFDLVSERWSNAGDDSARADSAGASSRDSIEISTHREPGTPVFSVECSRGDHTVVVWVAASDWTLGALETHTMRSIVSTLRLP
jgi:hypothetical protein